MDEAEQDALLARLDERTELLERHLTDRLGEFREQYREAHATLVEQVDRLATESQRQHTDTVDRLIRHSESDRVEFERINSRLDRTAGFSSGRAAVWAGIGVVVTILIAAGGLALHLIFG